MVTPLSGGAATVTVTATDVGGSNTSATQTFGVGVDRPPPRIGGPGGGRPSQPNRPPEPVGTLPDRTLTFGASPVVVDVAPAFEDPDDDELTYAASSSAEDVATVAVEGSVATVTRALTAAYATGRVRGEREAGGLVGTTEPPGTVTAGYWDTDTSGVQTGGAGRGLATAALQGPTAYGGLYAAWNVDVDGDGVVDGPWHFGTSAQYPVLSLDVDGDLLASWQELGRQLQAGPALTAVPAAVPARWC